MQAVLDGMLYLVGGTNGEGRSLSTAKRFNPRTGRKRGSEAIASIRLEHGGASCAVLDDMLYVVGGYDHESDSCRVFSATILVLRQAQAQVKLAHRLCHLHQRARLNVLSRRHLT